MTDFVMSIKAWQFPVCDDVLEVAPDFVKPFLADVHPCGTGLHIHSKQLISDGHIQANDWFILYPTGEISICTGESFDKYFRRMQ